MFTDTVDSKLLYVIVLYYLLLLTNYTGTLLPKKLTTYVANNKIAQYITGFFILLIFVQDKNVDTVKPFYSILKRSLIAYIIFISSTQMRLNYLISLIVLLLLFYFINIEYENKKNKKNHIQYIIVKNKKTIDTIFYILISGILIVGCYLYYLDHKTIIENKISLIS